MIKVDCRENFLNAPDNENYVLSGYDNMIFLYAKNGLKTTGDMIQDLKIIIGSVCGMDSDYVSKDNIYHIVYHVFTRWVKETEQYHFWEKLFNHGSIFFNEEIKFKEIVSAMLSIISLIQMKYPNKELHFSEIKMRDLKEY